MRCKNCKHRLTETKELPKKKEKGIAYFYHHSDDVGKGLLHADLCDCTNPEPDKKLSED